MEKLARRFRQSNLVVNNAVTTSPDCGKEFMDTNLDYIAKAPLDPYENAETMRLLFEERRNIKDGDLFVTYEGNSYPW